MVLLDYANVPAAALRPGLAALVKRVLAVLPSDALPRESKIVCRLYGGWYEGLRPSPQARELERAIRRRFPARFPFGAPARDRVARVEVELARSLRAAPKHDLHHTYRRRGAPRGLDARPLPFEGCARPGDCPLAPVHHLVNSERCPAVSCRVGASEVFLRTEQKLVDTMLTADLIQISGPGPTHIAVVTSDDDIWPGIYMATGRGAVVHHIRPAPSARRWPYASGVPTGYREYTLAGAAS